MTAALSRLNYFVNSAATVAAAGAGAVIDPAYPARNVLHPDPTLEAGWTYSAVAGTTYLQVNNGAALPPVNVVAAINVRLDPAVVTTFTLRIWNTSSATLDSWSFPIADCVPIPGTTDRFNFYGITPSTRTNAQHLFAMATTTASAGYVRVGHMWAGPGLVFPDGVDADWSLGYIDPTDVQRPPSGGLVSAPLPTRAVLSCPTTVQAYNVAMGAPGQAAFENMRNIVGSVGRSRPVVMVVRDQNLHTVQTMSVYGALSELTPIGHEGGDYFGTTFDVEQIR